MDKALSQVLDKRRVVVAHDIVQYLLKAESTFLKDGGKTYKGEHFGVPQKTIVDDVGAVHGWNEKRIRRTLADLLKIGLIRDAGAKRTVRMYYVSPSYLKSGLNKLANQFTKLEQKKSD